MTKIFIYIGLFILILGGVGFAFFSMTAPNIPQETVTRTLEPRDAFKMPTPTPLAPAPVPAPAPAAVTGGEE
jgi:hypothetical protein